LIVVAGFFIFSFNGCKKATREPDVIKIGAILPLTGDAALYGNNDREGIDLAIEIINAKGGIDGKEVAILYEDSKAEAKAGVSAINKLANSNISIIIDDAISTVTLAMLPIATEKKIIILSTGATNPSLSGASPYFFRIWNSDAEEGVFAANACYDKLSIKKMAIVYVNNDYGKGLKDVFGKDYIKLGGQIIAEESFEKGDKNFRGIVAKIKQANAEAIYLIGYASETGIVVKQLREAKVTSKIIGTVAMEDPLFLKLAGEASENVIYVFPKAPEGSAVSEFKGQFKRKYSKDPGLLCDAGYDAANLVIYAYQKGAKKVDEIRKVFTEIKDYKGASGEITFDSRGDVHKPMILKTVKKGKFEEYKEGMQ
jgi:branched-chain amino acid transport system substrate-binding protein